MRHWYTTIVLILVVLDVVIAQPQSNIARRDILFLYEYPDLFSPNHSKAFSEMRIGDFDKGKKTIISNKEDDLTCYACFLKIASTPEIVKEIQKNTGVRQAIARFVYYGHKASFDDIMAKRDQVRKDSTKYTLVTLIACEYYLELNDRASVEKILFQLLNDYAPMLKSDILGNTQITELELKKIKEHRVAIMAIARCLQGLYLTESYTIDKDGNWIPNSNIVDRAEKLDRAVKLVKMMFKIWDGELLPK